MVKKLSIWYKDHKTKQKEAVKVDVLTFIGRMVQHIMPKNFQRVRYFGLQATKVFKKWSKIIREGLNRIGRLVEGVYEVVIFKRYKERYMEVSNRDPFQCRKCGSEMELFRIWHPAYETIYDAFEEMKAGKYGFFDNIDIDTKDNNYDVSIYPKLTHTQLLLPVNM